MECSVIVFIIIMLGVALQINPELRVPFFTIVGVIVGIIAVIFIVSRTASLVGNAWLDITLSRHRKLVKRHHEIVKKAEKEGNPHELIKQMKNPIDIQIRLEAMEAISLLWDSQMADTQTVIDAYINALRDKEWQIREKAIIILEKIGDKRAIEPIFKMLQNDRSQSVRLACYSALNQISGSFKVINTAKFVRSAATEIRHLYSRTRTVDEEYEVQDEVSYFDTKPPPRIEVRQVLKRDPDTDSIRKLITLIPQELHDQVQVLSGEASYLFSE